MSIIKKCYYAFLFIWKRVLGNDLFDQAAQLAFYLLLSFFPLLLVAVAVVPYLPFSIEDVINVIRSFAPEETIKFIEANVAELSKKNISFLSFGIIVTLWSASNGVNGMIKVSNKAYDVTETRSFIVQRLLAIVFTILIMFVLVIAMLLSVFGKIIGTHLFAALGLSDIFSTIWESSRVFVSSIILLVVFIVIYGLAPSLKLKYITVLPGAIFATLGWELSSFAFSYYVSNFSSYAATYGSIGAIIVLLLWFYITAIVIVIGLEINAYFSKKNKLIHV